MSFSIPSYHFQLHGAYKEENQCKVHGYCIHVRPEAHCNVNKQFIVKPKASFIAVICNDHAADNSCLIPTKEGGTVHLQMTNESSEQALIVPTGASLWDIMSLEPISYNQRLYFDNKCPAFKSK